MINRRTALGIIASASTIGASGVTLAKEKKHLNGNALLGEKIKQNGKHKIHTIGKTDVFAEVNNGKVVGVSAAGMQVKKVKVEPETGRGDARFDPCQHAGGANGRLLLRLLGLRPRLRLLLLVYGGRRDR